MERVLLAGLPRSGSTLLCGLLNQNPTISICEESSLLPLINNVREFWAINIKNKMIDKQNKLLPILKAIFNSYDNSDCKIAIDKNREWMFFIDLIEKINGGPIKIICTVRNPVECAASFERLYKQDPFTYNQIEELLEPDGYTVSNRARSFLTHSGCIGKAYNAIQEASIIQGKKEQMLFIDYHKLCKDPFKQLERIYTFLNSDLYDGHTCNDVTNAQIHNDAHCQFQKTHDIEGVVRKGIRDLGRLDMIANEFYFEQFWSSWT